MDMNVLAERVRNVILTNRYLTMATCDGNTAWIAPLAYYVEPNYSFVYYSSKQARHTHHLEKNPIVACSIYDSSLPSDDVDGIQFSGKVTQVDFGELVHIVPKYFIQSFPIDAIRKRWARSLIDFKGLAAQRFYRIEPLDMFTIDLESVKEDKRIEVSLEVLRSVAMNK